MISIQPSKFGKGLLALVDIPKNTVITRVRGQILNFQDTIALNEQEGHALQIGPDRYILCDPPFVYSNHSCDPNCGLTADLGMKTLRPIKAGEELLWDYSTSMMERHWTMPCTCGAANCRGIVQDFDLLPEAIQRKYLRLHIVLPFIVEKMREVAHF